MARPGASVVRGVFVFFIAQLKNSLPNFNVGLTATEPSLKRRGQLSLYCPDGDLKALFINDTPYQKGVSGQSRTYSDAY
ncbi:hypothetical protein, partial [Paraburkholderia sp. BR14320]|uniref:hypothetical protein n=1 Tax=unclassified Paraburkholderia TaxID=2615204 RepID=UPI0034CF0930